MRAELAKLRELQRERSRKELRSVRWRKLNRRIARLYERIENRRRDFLHSSLRIWSPKTCFWLRKRLR